MVQIDHVRVGSSWMEFIVLFLKEDILPKGKAEANKVRRKARRFWLSEDQKLYKRSFFWAVFAIHSPRDSRVTLRRVT